MANPSPRNWIYFLSTLAGGSIQSAQNPPRIDRYRFEAMTQVRGERVADLTPGQELVRLNYAAPTQVAGAILCGSTQHLQYANGAQRDHLAAVSAPEFPASEDTVAVLIPIRKSAAWWNLAHDQRLAYFNASAHGEGHTAIGERYARRIYRQLLHSRYLFKLPYDFVTYFEFRTEHTNDFKALLANLRDETLNPEWAYVEMEQEIWLRKSA
jgi:hypothetical protein